MALKDVKSRIASVKNIQKITRAMEMVAAARLRRAEQRIEALRPYAGAIRRMTRQAAEAAGNVPNLPILNEHESEDKIAILLVTGDRVAIVYNRYVSPLTQEVTRETLLPLQHATIMGDDGEVDSLGERAAEDEALDHDDGKAALVEYEPDPEDILERLIPAYVEIS